MNTLHFSPTVTDVSCYSINTYFNLREDVDIEITPSATVYFSVEPEYAEWGIKSMNAIVSRVTFYLCWSCDAEYLTEEEKTILIAAGGKEYNNNTIEGSISLDTNEDQALTIEYTLEFSKDGSLSMDALQIDFKTKVITVNS